MVTPSASARTSMRWRCSSVRYTCVRVADIQHNVQRHPAQINGYGVIAPAPIAQPPIPALLGSAADRQARRPPRGPDNHG
jgi:hypothetical protein